MDEAEWEPAAEGGRPLETSDHSPRWWPSCHLLSCHLLSCHLPLASAGNRPLGDGFHDGGCSVADMAVEGAMCHATCDMADEHGPD